MNNKTGNLAWLDKCFCTSRKKEMSGFITGGTILGSYLWSLIGRCVFPVPRKKKSDTSCTLYQFSSKVKKKKKNRRNLVWQAFGQELRNTEVKPQSVFPDPVVLSSVVKGWCWWRRDTQWLSETVKENWGRKTDEIDVQWVPTHLKSSYWLFRLQTE